MNNRFESLKPKKVNSFMQQEKYNDRWKKTETETNDRWKKTETETNDKTPYKSKSYKPRNAYNRYNNKRRPGIQPETKFEKIGNFNFDLALQNSKNKQKKIKAKKEKEKKKEVSNIVIKEDINEILRNDEADIALTLAMAEKYQYYTESEEEEEEMLSTGLPNISPSVDNSAW